VRGGVQRTLESWLEAARKIGFPILLLAGSAALGFVIAWPLWFFATSQREAYTIFAFCCAGGAVTFLTVRGIIRRRDASRNPGAPRRTILSVLLTILLCITALAGGYLSAVLLYRGAWILALPAILVWCGLLWLLGLARRASKRRMERQKPAENNGK
jgi:CDP-diglyceride synthetase